MTNIVIKLMNDHQHKEFTSFAVFFVFFQTCHSVAHSQATKWRVQEKGHTSVSALEWGTNGDDLYCGFASGRLIQFRLRFVDGDMSHVPLPENFGSHVIQLSSSVDTLLISTMERALVLDTKTHKLDQVGRKDRKPGPYGGYLVHGGQKAYLSRPGLRMWAADSDGKVCF